MGHRETFVPATFTSSAHVNPCLPDAGHHRTEGTALPLGLPNDWGGHLDPAGPPLHCPPGLLAETPSLSRRHPSSRQPRPLGQRSQAGPGSLIPGRLCFPAPRGVHPRAAPAVDTHAHARLTSWGRGRKWSCAEQASERARGLGQQVWGWDASSAGAVHGDGEGSGGDPPESPGQVPSRRTGPLPVTLSRLDRCRWLTREGGPQGQDGGPGEGQEGR